MRRRIGRLRPRSARISMSRCPVLDAVVQQASRSIAGTGFGQEDVTKTNGIPVTRPICTLVDLATCLRPGPLEAAINEADKLDLVNPERLRTALDDSPDGLESACCGRSSTAAPSCSPTPSSSVASCRSRAPARPAKAVHPPSAEWIQGRLLLAGARPRGRDGRPALPPHAGQQARDRLRDQAHAAAGLTALRFTHAQVRYEPRPRPRDARSGRAPPCYGAGVRASIDSRNCVT